MENKNILQKSGFDTKIKHIDPLKIDTKVDIPWYNKEPLDPSISLFWDVCRFRWVWATKPTINLLDWDVFIDTSWTTQICIYSDWTRYCV